MTANVVILESSALPDDCDVIDVVGAEAMNALPEWSVTFVSKDPEIDFTKLIGAEVTLRLSDAQEGSTRPVSLVATHATFDGEERDGHRYVVTLSAAEWLLTLRSGYRIFTEKSAPEIVSEVLRDAGVPADRVVWRLAGSYERRPQCVQYGESDWAFVERLLADEGISYWFDALDERGGVLVLADSPNAHDGVVLPDVIPFEDASGMVSVRSLFEFEIAERLTIQSVHVRDYDVRQPDLFIEGAAGNGAFHHFEFPAGARTKNGAVARAQVRLEQLSRFAVAARGRSDCIRLQAGRIVRVEGLADEPMNRRYLVVGIEHTYTRPSADRVEPRPYRNAVRMVPARVRAFRPEPPQRAPRIDGLETAVTTGPLGEEIHVDDLGAVKLRFPWDRSGITDQRSSAWTRCLQLGMGGAMLLPRVGWEVPVGFLDGNPDYPVVLGRVYNATAIVPYALPAAAATTALQSATSPGGGSTNEIRMGDGAGGQELFVHASRDQSVTVGGSAVTKIGANETHDVTLSYGLAIDGAQTHSVGASQSVNVATDYMTGVKGGRVESIGGAEIVDVTANRWVGSGAYAELVGGAYTLRCNQSNTAVKGVFLQAIGASLGLAAGLGTSESVAAIRTENVGGARSILAGKFSESVTGVKSVTAGPTNEKAGGKVVTSAKAGGSVKVGGGAQLSAGGDLILDAPSITVDVGGSLNAKGLSLAGGALKAAKGTTKIKGQIVRKGGAKVE